MRRDGAKHNVKSGGTVRSWDTRIKTTNSNLPRSFEADADMDTHGMNKVLRGHLPNSNKTTGLTTRFSSRKTKFRHFNIKDEVVYAANEVREAQEYRHDPAASEARPARQLSLGAIAFTTVLPRAAQGPDWVMVEDPARSQAETPAKTSGFWSLLGY